MTDTREGQPDARLAALRRAPRDRWIALSADEARLVADAETFTAVVDAAARCGEPDPLILRTPVPVSTTAPVSSTQKPVTPVFL